MKNRGASGTPLDSGKNREDVASMFSTVAPRYDLLNTLISFGLHHSWRRLAVRLSGAGANATVLDLCCGTGDFMTSFARATGATGKIIGLDYCEEMLRGAQPKLEKYPQPHFYLLRGDATEIPFSDNMFDAVSIGFGIRNIQAPEKCLSEILRVLKPGGKVVILEGGWPRNPVASAGFYFFARFILPALGGILSGNKSAYRYLPESMRLFPARGKFLDLMRASGLGALSYVSLGMGSVFVYCGEKTS